MHYPYPYLPHRQNPQNRRFLANPRSRHPLTKEEEEQLFEDAIIGDTPKIGFNIPTLITLLSIGFLIWIIKR